MQRDGSKKIHILAYFTLCVVASVLENESHGFFETATFQIYSKVFLYTSFFISHAITIIILRYILYLVYFCPCHSLNQNMLYLGDLYFIFSFIFIVINHKRHYNRCTCFLPFFRMFSIIFGW